MHLHTTYKYSFILFLLLASIFVMSCGDSDDPDPQGSLVANAGADRNVVLGTEVSLNGNGSFDNNGGSFDFNWSFIAIPENSNATLENSDVANPQFDPDKAGKYQVQLAISNGQATSLDTVTVAVFDVINLTGTYTNLMPGPNVGIRQFEVYGDRLYATCEFTEIGGKAIKKIACFDGGIWFALGCGLDEGTIFDMEVYNNELYVTGRFQEIGCVDAKNIARWNGTSWNMVGTGIGDADDAAGFALEVYNNELYVGGRFTRAGDQTVSNIAKWDGSNWSAIGDLSGGSVRSLKVYDNRLYAGGFFDQVTGTNAEYLACYNGNQWSELGDVSSLSLRSTGVVRHMEVFDEKLYISGDFESNNIGFSELIVWDGSQFKDFGRAFSLSGSNEIESLVVFDEALYVGGEFSQVIGTQVNNLLKWDGEQWSILADGIGGVVLTIQPFDGQLYIGGDFFSAGNLPAEHIAIWSE